MPTYEYRCHVCLIGVDVYAKEPPKEAPEHCGHPTKRIWNSFTVGDIFQPHFNPGLGAYVNTRQEMHDVARRIEQNTFEKSGYQMDLQFDGYERGRDTINDDGMKATHDTQVATGQKDPTPKL